MIECPYCERSLSSEGSYRVHKHRFHKGMEYRRPAIVHEEVQQPVPEPIEVEHEPIVHEQSEPPRQEELLLSLTIIFTTQAIVIDGLDVRHIFTMSASVVARKFWYFVGFLVIAAFLMMLNSALFLSIFSSLSDVTIGHYIAVIVNAMIIVPFLEVFKVQIYFSKYSIL